MHALINKALQSYITACHGFDVWQTVALRARVPSDPLDIMLQMRPGQTLDILQAMTDVLGQDRSVMLEDLGTFLAAHPDCENLRRLLRFGGQNFMDFLLSLPDMPARVRLAVPDMPMTRLRISQKPRPVSMQAHLELICSTCVPGWAHVLLGLVRAMADDYGALALLDLVHADHDHHVISIKVIEAGFATPRQFHLRKPNSTAQAAQ